jgi:hypothetical protein
MLNDLNAARRLDHMIDLSVPRPSSFCPLARGKYGFHIQLSHMVNKYPAMQGLTWIVSTRVATFERGRMSKKVTVVVKEQRWLT